MFEIAARSKVAGNEVIISFLRKELGISLE